MTKEEEEAIDLEMVSFPSVMPQEQEQHISFPHFDPDYPLLMEGQDFIGRLGGGGGGVPNFLEDEFEHSALGTANIPILPSFRPQESSHHAEEDIGSLIDDFPPIDLFDQIEHLPSPSEWS